MKMFERVNSNIKNGYSKTYATLDNAITQINKAEEKLGITIEFFPMYQSDGRIAIVIPANRCYFKDVIRQEQEGAMIMSILIHGTKGWFIFN